MSKVEKAISWMEKLAKDDSHGYDQTQRWGEKGDYDCSASIYTAWKKAGIDDIINYSMSKYGCAYTGVMQKVFEHFGFKDVTKSINLTTGSGLMRGDILLNHQKHVAMYCGDGKEVEASINEKGTATGGTPGDQTGREILIRSYRNYPWNCVLRLEEKTPIANPTLRRGCVGTQTKYLQMDLNALGFKGKGGKKLTVDGDFGTNTEYALKAFQKKYKLTVDGIYGVKSRAKMASKLK